MQDLLQRLANTADACFVVDAEQRIVLWNRRSEALFGCREADVLGRDCAAVIKGLRASGRRLCCEDCPVVDRVRQGQLVRNYDLFTRAKSLRALSLNVGIVVLYDDDHDPFVVHYVREAGRRPVPVGRDGRHRERSDGRVSRGRRRAETWRSLTPRERDVLTLLGQGLSTGDMAKALAISPATVRNHVQSILDKLGVHGRLEAVAEVGRQGLLPWSGIVSAVSPFGD